MSVQITVRMPDELVAFIDKTVTEEQASGRAAIVERAIRRERRRMIAQHDAEIYAAIKDEGDEFDDMAAWVATQPKDFD